MTAPDPDCSSGIELADRLNTKIFGLESETATLRNEIHELEGLVRKSVSHQSIPVHEKTSSSSCRKCSIVILVLMLLVSGICYVKFGYNADDIEEWAHEGLNSIEKFVHHFNANKTTNTATLTTGNHQTEDEQPKTNMTKVATTEDVKKGQGKDLTYIDASHPTLIECFDNSGKNLALKKPTSQSSTFKTAISSLAVDGNREQKGSSASTRQEMAPWWKVDLEHEVLVDRVLIFNKEQGNSKHLENYHVELIDAGGDVVHHFHREETFYRVSYVEFPSGSKGRYVTVRLEGRGSLKLAEVEVYGTAKKEDVRNCLKKHVDHMKDRLKKRDQNKRNKVNKHNQTEMVPKKQKKGKKKKKNKKNQKQEKGKKEKIKQNQTEAVP